MNPHPGVLALLLIFGVVAIAFGGLLAAAGPHWPELLWAYIAGVVRFTLLQAALSTALSLVLGAALALALARRPRFPGRTLLVAALNLASVLPAIVAVFGIVAVLGRFGWVGAVARSLGLQPGPWLYGLPGILIAHVFFNAPLAARVFLGALNAVPGEHWRLADQLGLGPAALFRLVDWPLLRREALGVALIVGLLCLTSFAVVLALGGGPGAATLEVAIYSAVRFDVDFARAGVLALLQLAICMALVLPSLLVGARPGEAATSGAGWQRPDSRSPLMRCFDGLALALGAALVLPPLASVVVSGLAGLPSLADLRVLQALGTSFGIATPAAALAVSLALMVGMAARPRGPGHRVGSLLAAAPTLMLAVPPIALSAGLFVALRPVADPFALAAPLIVVVNGLMAFPFAMRQVAPPLAVSAERFDRLAESLGIEGLSRLRLVDWPLLRAPVLAGLAVALALSLGDLGAAAFFGSGAIVTLPLLLYERLGSYRSDEAAAVALLLALLVLALFLAAQRWSGDPLARSR